MGYIQLLHVEIFAISAHVNRIIVTVRTSNNCGRIDFGVGFHKEFLSQLNDQNQPTLLAAGWIVLLGTFTFIFIFNGCFPHFVLGMSSSLIKSLIFPRRKTSCLWASLWATETCPGPGIEQIPASTLAAIEIIMRWTCLCISLSMRDVECAYQVVITTRISITIRLTMLMTTTHLTSVFS